MKQLLALLGAAALILGAIAVRGLFFDDDGGSGGGGGDNDDVVTLVCVSELEDACRAAAGDDDSIAVVVEDAGTTLEKLTAGDTDYDGWLTLDPWPEVVAVGQPVQALGAPSEPLASTELLIAVPGTAQPCAGEVDWRCLGESDADVGLPPRTGALGLLLLGNAVSGYFGRVEVATNDFDAAFDAWFESITSNSGEADPLSELLLFFPPTLRFQAVGTSRAEFDEEVPDDVPLDPVVPDPTARANVVFAPVAGADGAERAAELAGADSVRDALTDAGWDGGDEGPANLPSAGLLYALLTR